MIQNKTCNCAQPKITQQLPEGFSGTIVCAKCEGIATISQTPAKKYEGSDPVEGMLFAMAANSGGSLTFEQAVLTMLIRIESALLRQPKSGPKGS